ncbi:MAG: MltA domain-containing protein [Syntrophotaleaceae bacterium]
MIAPFPCRQDILRFVCCLLVLALGSACARRPSPIPPEPVPVKAPVETLQAVSWEELPGWTQDDLQPALAAFITSCPSLSGKPQWQSACAEARQVDLLDDVAVRRFFEDRFVPHRVNNPDGSDLGLITGYYVPDLQGSRTPSERFRSPVLGVPDDLLVIDLGTLYPDLQGRRLRGRLDGRRVVPYWSRREIDDGRAPSIGKSCSGWKIR